MKSSKKLSSIRAAAGRGLCAGTVLFICRSILGAIAKDAIAKDCGLGVAGPAPVPDAGARLQGHMPRSAPAAAQAQCLYGRHAVSGAKEVCGLAPRPGAILQFCRARRPAERRSRGLASRQPRLMAAAPAAESGFLTLPPRWLIFQCMLLFITIAMAACWKTLPPPRNLASRFRRAAGQARWRAPWLGPLRNPARWFRRAAPWMAGQVAA